MGRRPFRGCGAKASHHRPQNLRVKHVHACFCTTSREIPPKGIHLGFTRTTPKTSRNPENPPPGAAQPDRKDVHGECLPWTALLCMEHPEVLMFECQRQHFFENPTTSLKNLMDNCSSSRCRLNHEDRNTGVWMGTRSCHK